MSSPGFLNRIRTHLATDEFEGKIDHFMRKYASRVCPHPSESKDNGSSPEYSLEAHEIFQDYLGLIEGHMKEFQSKEKLSDYDFKVAVEDIAIKNPILVRYMIASWEFQQFYDMCKEYLEKDVSEGKSGDDDDGGKDEK